MVRVRFEKINDDLMTLSGAPKDLEVCFEKKKPKIEEFQMFFFSHTKASLPAAPSVSDSVDRSAVTELRRVLGLSDALVERRQVRAIFEFFAFFRFLRILFSKRLRDKNYCRFQTMIILHRNWCWEEISNLFTNKRFFYFIFL